MAAIVSRNVALKMCPFLYLLCSFEEPYIFLILSHLCLVHSIDRCFIVTVAWEVSLILQGVSMYCIHISITGIPKRKSTLDIPSLL